MRKSKSEFYSPVKGLRAMRSKEETSAKAWYSLVSSFTKFVPAFPVGTRKKFLLHFTTSQKAVDIC